MAPLVPTPLKKAVFGLVAMRKSESIVGVSYQLLLISNNSCHTATKLAACARPKGGTRAP